ncbi:uncharacterized protein LOC111705990 isoform X3 [Eurytemora carolleeae]|uniref:uncharacterized protein LOC111705990 isoform X3 n=1 Tax=Eurytemora carolleeae TaxID=1294199 RepID=UPI000C776CE3|nr:uncharacterized protein LOC111705990 isoform X3 [Eurytemora carolleeae]|eukprot:XP_023334488.1 uncharacterized protein LOC111705990 isoform X3 [Eurytemora affinis]
MAMYLELECREGEEEFQTIFWQVLDYVISSVGIIGNLISISILVKKEFRETFHRLLLSLAVVDLIFIISVVIRNILRNVRQEKEQFLNQLNASIHRNGINFTEDIFISENTEDDTVQRELFEVRHEVIFLENVTDIFSFEIRFMYFASIYFIVSISAERYFGVCYPIKSRVKGRKRFYLYFIPVLMLSALIEIPKMITILKQINNIEFSKQEKSFLEFYFDYAKPFMTIYLPLILLILLNTRIFHTIRNSRNSLRVNAGGGPGGGSGGSGGSDKERNFATILVSIVLLFLFTHSLRVLNQIYRDSTDRILKHCANKNLTPVIPRWLRTMTLLVELEV